MTFPNDIRSAIDTQSTIDSEGFMPSLIMPRDAVSRTANVEHTGRHKWVNHVHHFASKCDESRACVFTEDSLTEG